MMGGKVFEPGLYYDLPNDVYRAAEGVSQSDLKILADQSPAHLKAKWDGLIDDTSEAKDFGNLVHDRMHNPDCVQNWAIKPTGMSFAKTDGKEWKARAEADGRQIVPQEDWNAISAIHKNVMADPLGSKLYGPGKREVSAFWRDPFTGTMMKCRFDSLPDGSDAIGDLKTCSNGVGQTQLSKSIYTFKHHWQVAVYLDGATALDLGRTFFFFVFADTKAPNFVTCRQLHPEDIELGREEYRQALDLYTQCAEKNEWPLDTSIERGIIRLPRYARKNKFWEK